METISKETAGQHYGEHQGKPFYDDLVAFITRGPAVLMVVEGPEAYSVVRTLMGTDQPPPGGARHHPGRPGHRADREPGPRLRLAGIGGPGDRSLLRLLAALRDRSDHAPSAALRVE